jgi:hypothetical protein
VLLYRRDSPHQMDDQNGHVIDGTTRAHQWRRLRSQTARNDEDDQAPRSDAPKSIAGSLLVPADMLEKTGPLEHPDDRGAHHEDTEPSRSAPIAPPQTAGASAGPVVHQNPFLVPDAAAPRVPRQRSRIGHARRAIIGWAHAFRARQAWFRVSRRSPAGGRTVRRAVWLAGFVFVVLASGAVALTALIRPSSPAITPPAQIEALGATVSSRNLLESRPLAAVTTHVARQRPARTPRSHRVRSVRARHSAHTHGRSRSARKPMPARVHYRAPASSAPDVPTSAPQTTGSANSASSRPSAPTTNNVPPSPPPASTGGSTSSSTQHQPAFGSNGVLGPGHSPDG